MATIVFIEDEAPLRRFIAADLREAGHTVIEAGDGREGLQAIVGQRPDLVLCDVNMPGVTGYDVLAALRSDHPDLGDAPFVFLSALADRRDVVAGKQLGADDYLAKPVDFEVLRATSRALVASGAVESTSRGGATSPAGRPRGHGGGREGRS